MKSFKIILAVSMMLPVASVAVTPVGHGHHVGRSSNLTPAKRAEVRVDRQAVRTDKQTLNDAYQNLRNDQRHGNASEVRADRQQIGALKEQLRNDSVELRNDRGYSYVRRNNNNTNGWGQSYNNSGHNYRGWGN